MQNQLFATDDIILFPLAAAFAVTAVIYFFRLLGSLIFKSRRKYRYHALWALPYGLLLFCAYFPQPHFSGGWFMFFAAVWIFLLLCAIIQRKVSVEKSWRLIWEEAMKCAVKSVEQLRRFLLAVGRICARVPVIVWVLVCVLLALVGIAIVCKIPQSICILLLICWGILFFCLLCWCIASCKALIFFWLVLALMTACFLGVFLQEFLQRDMISDIFIYCFVCAVLIMFWCLSAGVADYDVAKMAGAIINTTTTILLIAANIFLGWLQWDAKFDLPFDSDLILYMVNLTVFPVVAAGYLSMLFVDGLEYCRKRLKPLDTGNSDPESD